MGCGELPYCHTSPFPAPPSLPSSFPGPSCSIASVNPECTLPGQVEQVRHRGCYPGIAPSGRSLLSSGSRHDDRACAITGWPPSQRACCRLTAVVPLAITWAPGQCVQHNWAGSGVVVHTAAQRRICRHGAMTSFLRKTLAKKMAPFFKGMSADNLQLSFVRGKGALTDMGTCARRDSQLVCV